MQKIILSVMLMFVIAACTPRIGGTDVSVKEAGVMSSVQYGTIMSISDVVVNNDESGSVVLGTVGGAAAGGVIGNQFGGGSGRTIMTVGGAILGAIAGSEMTKIVQEQKGYQLVIKLDSGKVTAIVQGADVQFHTGQKVQIISSGGKHRVLPI